MSLQSISTAALAANGTTSAEKKKQSKAATTQQRLLKLRSAAHNKACADCPARFPAYVVPQWGVWVCAQCAQAHRSAGHAVKSPTMGQFKPIELDWLEACGGNEAAANLLLASRGGFGAGRLPSHSSDVYVKRAYDELAFADDHEACRRHTFDAFRQHRMRGTMALAGGGSLGGPSILSPFVADPFAAELQADGTVENAGATGGLASLFEVADRLSALDEQQPLSQQNHHHQHQQQQHARQPAVASVPSGSFNPFADAEAPPSPHSPRTVKGGEFNPFGDVDHALDPERGPLSPKSTSFAGKCPVCGVLMPPDWNNDRVNAHIDRCLGGAGNISSSALSSKLASAADQRHRTDAELATWFDLAKEPWYFGNVDRIAAERALNRCKEDSFLVRTSSQKGAYALSIFRYRTKRITHTLLKPVEGGGYQMQDSPNVFPTLLDLVKFSNECKNIRSPPKDSVFLPDML